MKKIVLLLLLASSSMSAGNWITSFEDAQKLAIATDRLILVDFWASWCAPCIKMDQESWSNPEVKQILDGFIPLKVDIEKDRQFAQRYGIRSIPYVFIMDAHGEVLYKSSGYMNKEEVMEMLRNYALNTEFVKNETLSFYQHQSYVSALRLAQKYIDYSLFLKDKVKEGFLRVADSYLRKGKRMLDKKQSNHAFMLQKMDLVAINIDLYLEDYKKAERQLDKLSEGEIDNNNKDLYSFLHYCLAKVREDETAVTKYKQELESQDSALFLKKSELLFPE